MIKKILIADDDRGSALLVRTQLERYDYEVTTAGNGREALIIISSQPVDLLITDVVMPEMDGVDLYLALKKNKITADLPIIIVTDKQMFKESFASLGVDHFIPKMSDVSLLLEKIKEIERAAAASNPRDYHKVLIGGSQSLVVDQMKAILQEHGCLVSTADNSMDLANKAFLMVPHVILLDVMMRDNASTPEIIRSFRCFHFLGKTSILTYVHLLPEQIGQDPASLSVIEEEVKLCQAAGSTKHLGRFNRLTFLDSLQEFGIKPNNGA